MNSLGGFHHDPEALARCQAPLGRKPDMRHARMSSGFGDWKLQKQAEGEGSEADLGG